MWGWRPLLVTMMTMYNCPHSHTDAYQQSSRSNASSHGICYWWPLTSLSRRNECSDADNIPLMNARWSPTADKQVLILLSCTLCSVQINCPILIDYSSTSSNAAPLLGRVVRPLPLCSYRNCVARWNACLQARRM